jgi:malonyl-CoA O-methyltransferase
VSVLAPREGYRLWAPGYQAETAISCLEDRIVRDLTPSLAEGRLADVGCGTGRRLRRCGAAFAVGIDLTPEMMVAGEAAGGGESFVAGDLGALPLASSSFDVVWCRLVIGHLPEVAGPYRELARICRPGGLVIVTDFHPEAAAAGHKRTFRDEAGDPHEIEHHVHDTTAHLQHARSEGLELIGRREGRVGPEIRAFYARSGRLHVYDEQRGLALVLALAFLRVPDA